jgi:D-glycero-D-manno-heptose 1,7-bisphosphate phosphatase
MQKAIFFDRDGVINFDPGDYTTSIKDFVFLPDVLETLPLLQKQGFALFVITNQGGIAKGLYSHDEFKAIDAFMHNELRAHEIEVKETFYCPHHPDYCRCLCRKPLSGLILKAIAKYKINPELSYMVGDKVRDIICAENAGVTGIMIPTNSSIRFIHNLIK